MIQLEICIELNWQYGSCGAKDLFILHTFFILLKSCIYFELAFPKRRDSAILLDNGTKVPSLSLEKGTREQAQNLVKGRDEPGQPVKIRVSGATVIDPSQD